MTRRIDRRQALAVFGTVSLGGLLAACGDDNGGSNAVNKGEGTSEGSSGTSTSVQPKTTTSATTAELFDESASCSLTPEETEGPYYFDVDSIRSDIREDRPGTLLTLAIRVRDEQSCDPIENAVVDIWHCDALGLYSDVHDSGFDTVGKKFLRGFQLTDARGEVRFVTVYPGWYPGRTVHIHFKIRTAPVAKRSFEFTSQLYFDDGLTDRVHAAPPYAEKGLRTTRNQHDWIFRRDGDRLMLGATATADGYAATFPISLQFR